MTTRTARFDTPDLDADRMSQDDSASTSASESASSKLDDDALTMERIYAKFLPARAQDEHRAMLADITPELLVSMLGTTVARLEPGQIVTDVEPHMTWFRMNRALDQTAVLWNAALRYCAYSPQPGLDRLLGEMQLAFAWVVWWDESAEDLLRHYWAIVELFLRSEQLLNTLEGQEVLGRLFDTLKAQLEGGAGRMPHHFDWTKDGVFGTLVQALELDIVHARQRLEQMEPGPRVAGLRRMRERMAGMHTVLRSVPWRGW